MKLAAVFVVWADCADLLPYAVENIRPVVDEIIIVWSRKSNRGQVVEYDLPQGCTLIQWEPVFRLANHNELSKRNVGLEAVKKGAFTHFIMMDVDEFYRQDEFLKAKAEVNEKKLIGSVCRIQTYFKSPTLTIGYDHTLVPFIHRVNPRLRYKLNYHAYPFAYHEGSPRIDPTRRLNVSGGVQMVDITMHHYSYVRKDMALKLENSSANFKGSRAEVIYEDLAGAKPGYFCKGYKKTLIECENIFNLPVYE